MSGSLFSRMFPVPRSLSMEGGGVELSERSVKYLSLAHRAFGRRVAVYGEEPLPQGAIEDGEIKDMAGVCAALAAVRQRCGFRFAHVSLPERRGYLFDLPVPRSGELADHVLLAMPEHVPLSPAEVVFDCETVLAESTPETLMTVVTVFPEALAESYAAAFGQAGFLPLSFELEPQASARAVTSRMETARQGAHLFIDLGVSKSLFCIVQNGVPRFTTSVEGSAMLDASFGEHATFEEVRKIKDDEGLAVQGEFSPAFSKYAAGIAAEANRLVIYWNTRSDGSDRHESVRSVILYGGNASTKKLADRIAEVTGVPVAPADLRPALTGHPDVVPPVPKNESLRYATVIGLALRVGGTALW